MKHLERLTANQRMLVAFADGRMTAAPVYCMCSSPLCRDSVVVTAVEALEAARAGYRITSLAHAVIDGAQVVLRTGRYAALL